MGNSLHAIGVGSHRIWSAVILLALSACKEDLPEATEDLTRDILTTQLSFDVATLEATATLEVQPSSSSTGLSLEAQGLAVKDVTLPDGTVLNWQQRGDNKRLDIGLPVDRSSVVIHFTVTRQGFDFNGFMDGGDTFIWPNYCGNLFPCHSDPADGMKFSVDVTGLPAGQIAVAPKELLTLDAPSYQLGFTVGNYTRHDLGTTTAGTRVVFYSLPTDNTADVEAGTASYRDYVDTLEKHFGPYPFGPETGAKSVIWCEGGGCEYAGMEEHPYFDVSDGSVHDPTVYSHEAAHAWFGDGVRLECWGEDLIMSEGTAAYLELAIIGLVDGEAAAQEDIQYYREWLAESRAAGDDHIVWPETCDEVNTYDIWYSVTYSRGALFWVDVEKAVGREPLLAALSDFTDTHLGETASMSDLLDTVQESTGFDPYPLANVWLRSTNLPADYEEPSPPPTGRSRFVARPLR